MMRQRRNYISMLFLGVYMLWFAHTLVPHCHYDIFSHASSEVYSNAEFDASFSSRSCETGIPQDKGILSLLAQLLSDTNHLDLDDTQPPKFVEKNAESHQDGAPDLHTEFSQKAIAGIVQLKTGERSGAVWDGILFPATAYTIRVNSERGPPAVS